MSLRDDAILLSGFIYGTASSVPAAIRHAIDRITAPQDTDPALTTPPPTAQVAPAEEPQPATIESVETGPMEKKPRKKVEWSPERRAAAAARMQAMRASGKCDPNKPHTGSVGATADEEGADLGEA